MEAEQEVQEGIQGEEKINGDIPQEQEVEQETYATVEEAIEEKREQSKQGDSGTNHEDRSSFIHGLAVGLGLGCVATFVIMWVTVFFTPQMPQSVTYEALLSIFIYPLIYLLAVGLIALTAGIVREYYAVKNKL